MLSLKKQLKMFVFILVASVSFASLCPSLCKAMNQQPQKHACCSESKNSTQSHQNKQCCKQHALDSMISQNLDKLPPVYSFLIQKLLGQEKSAIFIQQELASYLGHNPPGIIPSNPVYLIKQTFLI